MSDYTKTTNFTAKDALLSGDPNKLIKGSLFDTEFDALSVAIATKEDVSNKGAVSGYCPLDASTQVALTYIPTTLTGKNADLLDGYHAGNSSGQIPVSNGTICSNLNAGLLNGKADTDFFAVTGDTITGNLVLGTGGNVTSGSSSNSVTAVFYDYTTTNGSAGIRQTTYALTVNTTSPGSFSGTQPDGFSLSRLGTGSVRISYTGATDNANEVIVVGCPGDGTIGFVTISNRGLSSFDAKLYGYTGSATDGVIQLIMHLAET